MSLLECYLFTEPHPESWGHRSHAFTELSTGYPCLSVVFALCVMNGNNCSRIVLQYYSATWTVEGSPRDSQEHALCLVIYREKQLRQKSTRKSSPHYGSICTVFKLSHCALLMGAEE